MCKGKCAIRAKYVRRWVEDGTYNDYVNYDAKVTGLIATLRAAQAMPVVGIGTAAIAEAQRAAVAQDICKVFQVSPEIVGLNAVAGFVGKWYVCGECNGRGVVTNDGPYFVCDDCGGTGRARTVDAVDVKIEPVSGAEVDAVVIVEDGEPEEEDNETD